MTKRKTILSTKDTNSISDPNFLMIQTACFVQQTDVILLHAKKSQNSKSWEHQMQRPTPPICWIWNRL